MITAVPPLEIAVVGHTNAGKTSLLRTLARQRHFGTVADQPGTTRHVERIDLCIDGVVAVRYFDTPGLEDAAALQQYLKNLPGEGTPVERVRAFLKGPEAHAAFEQEAKVLRTLLAVDAAIYVIDCREEVLPKYRYEIEILSACAKPVMPVLNFLRSGHSQEAQWRETLAAYHLHAWVQFDAVAPFTGAERQLYQDLGVLLRARRTQLQAITDELEAQAHARRVAATQLAASVLVTAASMRREIGRDAAADAFRKAALVRDFKASLAVHVDRGVQAMLAVYGFGAGDADVHLAPWASGRWQTDLFNPHTLADAGQKLGTGAAVGAAVGLVADVALAGLSLGAATALGAAVGGLASQGWSQVPRKIANRVRGTEELTLENEVLLLLAGSLLHLCAALEQRGHAALDTLHVAAAGDADPPQGTQALAALVRSLAPARSYPQWELAQHDLAGADARRSRLVERVAQGLRTLLQEFP
ncbi:GTP-binding protein [Acidovorax sp. SRB_14]|uniref:GTPase/DUF3482 domain-containing protein n=1 Tax=unclassified Acidovorax TaxID=2684926 RepID=UPI00145F8815|nr:MULTISPECIES: GTPase/DUF3482 domain-containing protein [unclassified Acidovorax]NMM77466.1 GTP-binding protein [Acidovorax sp. SRB_24]NMM82341.1 GTP-binding protein [Acidovorax sp. SRB_14]NMM90343.1 GTP-binding protein [Rhodococcus sp. SRB_17]